MPSVAVILKSYECKLDSFEVLLSQEVCSVGGGQPLPFILPLLLVTLLVGWVSLAVKVQWPIFGLKLHLRLCIKIEEKGACMQAQQTVDLISPGKPYSTTRCKLNKPYMQANHQLPDDGPLIPSPFPASFSTTSSTTSRGTIGEQPAT